MDIKEKIKEIESTMALERSSNEALVESILLVAVQLSEINEKLDTDTTTKKTKKTAKTKAKEATEKTVKEEIKEVVKEVVKEDSKEKKVEPKATEKQVEPKVAEKKEDNEKRDGLMKFIKKTLSFSDEMIPLMKKFAEIDKPCKDMTVEELNKTAVLSKKVKVVAFLQSKKILEADIKEFSDGVLLGLDDLNARNLGSFVDFALAKHNKKEKQQ